MNKLIIVTDFFERGGATRMMADLSHFLEKDDILLCGGIIDQKPEKYGFQYSKAELYKVSFFSSNLITYTCIALQAWVSIGRIIKKTSSPVTIVLNNPASAIGVLLNPLSWGKKKIYLFHGAFDLEIQSRRKSKLKLLSRLKSICVDNFFWIMQKIVLEFASDRIVFSNYAANILSDHFLMNKRSIEIALPSLNTQRLKDEILPLAKRAILRKKLNPKNEVLFYVPSRLEPRKGIDIVVKAAAVLKEKKIKFKIIFSGDQTDGYYTAELQQLSRQDHLGSYLSFISPLDREKTFHLYQVADAVIMPSRSLETLGMVTLESLFYGTPVIGFMSGASSEILGKVKGRTKLLCPSNEPNDLSQYMENISLLNPHQKKQLMQHSQQAFNEFLNRPLRHLVEVVTEK